MSRTRSSRVVFGAVAALSLPAAAPARSRCGPTSCRLRHLGLDADNDTDEGMDPRCADGDGTEQPHLQPQEGAARRAGAGRHRRGQLRAHALPASSTNPVTAPVCPNGHYGNDQNDSAARADRAELRRPDCECGCRLVRRTRPTATYRRCWFDTVTEARRVDVRRGSRRSSRSPAPTSIRRTRNISEHLQVDRRHRGRHSNGAALTDPELRPTRTLHADRPLALLRAPVLRQLRQATGRDDDSATPRRLPHRTSSSSSPTATRPATPRSRDATLELHDVRADAATRPSTPRCRPASCAVTSGVKTYVLTDTDCHERRATDHRHRHAGRHERRHQRQRSPTRTPSRRRWSASSPRRSRPPRSATASTTTATA